MSAKLVTESDWLAALADLGLAAQDARVYLFLLRNGAAGAQTVADALQVSRGTIYPVLRRLQELGWTEGETGYASRYRAIPPEFALEAAAERQRQRAEAAETLAKSLIEPFSALADAAPADGLDDLLEIVRGRAIDERFTRLQLEARESAIAFVTGTPLISQPHNPAQKIAAARGVRYRGIYDPEVAKESYVRRFIREGEEARIAQQPLPLKMAVFDGAAVIVPLTTAGTDRVTALVVRHAGLAAGLCKLFECVWEQSTPMPAGSQRP